MNHLVPMDQRTTTAAPSKVLTTKVFQWWDYPVFMLLTGMGFGAIAYFLWYWFSFEDWLHYPVTFSLMTILLMASLLNNQMRWFSLLYMRRPLPMTPRSGWKIGVATTFVPGAEPLDMLEVTVRALIAMDYPHDTWVLDEGDDDQVRALCQKLGANHFSRKHRPHYQTERGTFQSHSKHGNYNAWLAEIGFDRYDIITAFDPDHVPESSFLSHVLGYFDDPQVGYVQVAPAYYNQQASFIARGAAEETYAFYSSLQMASYAMGYPIVVGCHNTHRVTALKQVGGFGAHDADDQLTTLLYRSYGWQGVYIPEILARGLTPVDWQSYLIQQRRWARSVLDIKCRIYPQFAGCLSFRTRAISLLHGINYLSKSLIICPSIILTAFMLATGITPNVVSNFSIGRLALLCIALQFCDLYRQRFYLDWKREFGLRWRSEILQYAKWPYMLLAVYDVMLNRQRPYTLTKKVKAEPQHYFIFWPQMMVLILICIAWVIGTFSERIVSPSFHVLATVIVLSLSALMLTEFVNPPHPYDKTMTSSHSSQ